MMSNVEELRDGLQATIREDEFEVYLAMIYVNEDRRNQGIGTAYIKELIHYVETCKKRLTLNPSDLYGGNLRRLKKFYTRLGFKCIGRKWEYFGK